MREWAVVASGVVTPVRQVTEDADCIIQMIIIGGGLLCDDLWLTSRTTTFKYLEGILPSTEGHKTSEVQLDLVSEQLLYVDCGGEEEGRREKGR